MPNKSSKVNYQQLSQELDTILDELQRDDLDVDKALEHYKRGLELAKQLENYLSEAENQIRDIKSKFEAE